MPVCGYVLVRRRLEEGIGSPGARITGGISHPMQVLRASSDPMQDSKCS